jgi:hypothetical protein
MFRIPKTLTTSIVLILGLPVSGTLAKGNKSNPVARETAGEGPAVLWREPVDIASRNLFYGPGGEAHAPHSEAKFEKEDMNGTSPKFDIVDEDGVKWRVKMGDEARPETVASRLVWAVGYFANEDYFLPMLHVQNMQHLRRGANLVSPDGTVHNVRLKRHLKGEKKIGNWSWAANPFKATREWNGLRVLMAVMNNWDLKDINNAVYQVAGDSPEQLYMVSDLGASFGTAGLSWTPHGSKGNLKAYSRSKWIKTISAEFVDFNVPSVPAPDNFFNVAELGRGLSLLWIGHHIPRADAKWMGQLLAQLSPAQIRDAFRAAGYAPQDVEEFSRVVEKRIGILERL